MQSSNKTIVITILICAGITSLCSAATATSNTKSKQPTAFELLDKYAENQDKLNSFIAKTESVSKRYSKDTSDKQAKMRRTMTEFRYEKSGSNLKAYYWFRHDENQGDDGTWLPADRCNTVLWDGKLCFDYYKAPHLDASHIYAMSDKDYIKQAIAIGYAGAGPILGILYGNIDRFDSILRQSDSVSVRSELERIGSVDCYVIDARSKHGTYTVWLDPEHGYGIARAIVHQGPEDLLHGRPISSYSNADSYEAKSFSLENVKFENIEGVWIPIEADYHAIIREKEGTRTGQDHYKITQIDVNPNHAELQSFVLNVQNGTEVRIVGAPGIEHKWQEGMKFVVDEWDSSIKYVPKDWSILVGVNKPLPKFEGVKLGLSADQIENRAILLCFFDLEQRPSRHCIIQLAKQVEQLKQKGITVLAVQALKIDENTLKEWITKYNIPFTIGAITADVEKARFIWGVRSLPWLILTDKNHVVCAEGFSMSELDEKINAITQR